MGVFSKHHRYHEAGKRSNVNNESRFGTPAYSLYTTSKVFTLHHHIDIIDDNEVIKYQSDSKFLTLHDRTYISDSSGRQIAHMYKKIFSLHERHYVEMKNGTNFCLSNELFHIYKDITNIEGLGWQLRGNMFALNFEIYDALNHVIAVIGQKMLSIHDKYCIDIYRPEYEEIIVAIVITLQHMIRDRENASSSSSGGSSSS